VLRDGGVVHRSAVNEQPICQSWFLLPSAENFRLTPEVKATFTGKLEQAPRDFFGRKVKQVVRTDGLKLVCEDGSWACYRVSGTEPVVRVFSEAGSEPELEKLSAADKQWIFE